MCEERTIQQLLPKQAHNPKIFNTCKCEVEPRYNFTFEEDNIKQRNKQIMEMRKLGKKYAEIAKKFGISTQRAHQIVNNEKLKQLEKHRNTNSEKTVTSVIAKITQLFEDRAHFCPLFDLSDVEEILNIVKNTF
jgi:Glu-tRNA(Gln) amidotransferase subunit E-like FAD-binding protein